MLLGSNTAITQNKTESYSQYSNPVFSAGNMIDSRLQITRLSEVLLHGLLNGSSIIDISMLAG